VERGIVNQLLFSCYLILIILPLNISAKNVQCPVVVYYMEKK